MSISKSVTSSSALKALQDYTFNSKYARYNPILKRRETWVEAVNRVRQMHLQKFPEITEDINWAFDQVKDKRVLGSQRALQYGGEPILRKNARIFNCTVSYCDRIQFFQEALWMLLCGCGVGFSVQKHHIAKLPNFSLSKFQQKQIQIFTIPDSIEGWADALGVLLATYFFHEKYKAWAELRVEFDYSLIRPKGSYLASGAGKAPGPEPLRKALEKIRSLLDHCVEQGQQCLRTIDAYDIVMHASDAVLSGGVRRSATICVFSSDDDLMIKAKTGDWFYTNPQRGRSNNSAMLLRSTTTREQFHNFMESVKQFGEPGFIWSDSTEMLFNPCVESGMHPVCEISGESGWQFCVSGDTKLLTANGIEYIKDRVGKETKIWNGQEWRAVVPFQTGKNRKLYRVYLSDGSHLDCTSNHIWLVKDRFMKDYVEVTTNKLLSFSKYKLHTPPPSVSFKGGMNEPLAYDYGFILGDGNVAKRKDTVSKNFRPGSTAKKNKNGVEYIPVLFDKVDRRFSYKLKYSQGLPKEIFSWNHKSLCAFIAGWMDADGTKASRGFRIYGREDKIRDLQLLLTKMGHYSSVNLLQEAGVKTNISTRKQSVWYIQVPEVKNGLYSKRMELTNKTRKQQGKGLYQVICDVEQLPGLHDTFCLTENKQHLCLFNNVLTHQCNLCEINGRKCRSAEDFLTAAKAAAIIGTLQAAYTDFSYLGQTTKDITDREALLGVSITGMMDNPSILFDPELQQQAAKLVIATNKEIAAKIGIKPCARGTCIKPAGTTSCLLGTASGIHAHHAKRYIRRVQANELEPSYQFYKQYNPRAIQKSAWKNNDGIIAFCIETPEKARTKKEIDAITLLQHVRLTQQNWVAYGKVDENCTAPWLRHSVSNTINVQENEWDKVEEYIYNFREDFAGVALLSHTGDLDYRQAPFVAIHTPSEIAEIYGDGSLMASGLIVDGLRIFQDDLWLACDAVLGLTDCTKQFVSEEQDWIRRAKQFAVRYFEDDLRRMTYCLKEVNNWKYWCDVKRETTPVDYSLLIEEEDNTVIQETLACAGGVCNL